MDVIDDLDLGGRLSLDDQMSPALDRLSQRWSTVTATIGTRSTALMQRASQASTAGATYLRNFYSGAVDFVDAGTTRLASALNISEKRLGVGGVLRSIVGAGGRGIATTIGSMAALTGQSSVLAAVLGGPVGVAAGLHRVVQGAISAGSEIENLGIAFTTMLGSAQAAQQHLDELQRFAIGKPFEFSYLAGASRTLQTYGFQVSEVTGLLRDMGDAAFTANTGTEGVDRMIRVFGSTLATGRMTRGALNSLVRAGVPAYQILREQLHMTDEELSNIARSGRPAREIIDALRAGMQQRFGGGLDRAAATLSARLSDLADVVGLFRRTLYGSLGTTLVPVIAGVTDFLVRNVEKISSVVGTAINTALRLVMVLVMPVFGALSDVMARTDRGARTHVGSILGTLRSAALVIEGVSALIVGDDGRGITRVSTVLRERLVRAGLWHTAVQIALFANRARALIGGFVEGFAGRMGETVARIRAVAAWFGITGMGMMRTREQASALGARVATLVGIFLSVRAALMVGVPVVSAFLSVLSAGATVVKFARSLQLLSVMARGASLAMTGIRAAVAFGQSLNVLGALARGASLALTVLRAAAMFLIANPVVAVVVAVVAALAMLAYYLSRNAAFMARLREAGAAVATVLRAVWASISGAVVNAASAAWRGIVSAFHAVVGVLGAVWRALAPVRAALRVIGAFIAVVLYLAIVAWGALAVTVFRSVWSSLKGIGTVLGYVGRFLLWLGRGIGALFTWMGGGVRTVVSLLVMFGIALAARFAPVLSVLRVVGSFIGVVLYLGLVAVGALVKWLAGAIVANFVTAFRLVSSVWRRTSAAVGEGVRVVGAFLSRMWTRVSDALGNVWTGIRDRFIGALGPLWPYLASMFASLSEVARTAFEVVAAHILDPFRFIAGQLVRIFNALPDQLRPAALMSSIQTLTDFANGGGTAPNDRARAQLSDNTAAPTRAINAVAGATTAAAANNRGATVTVQPAPVVLNLDGRTVAETVIRYDQDDTTRRGGIPRGTGPLRR